LRPEIAIKPTRSNDVDGSRDTRVVGEKRDVDPATWNDPPEMILPANVKGAVAERGYSSGRRRRKARRESGGRWKAATLK